MANGGLTKLPLTGQLAVSIGIALVIGGIFYWQFWSPMVEEETQKKDRLATLRKEIAALEVTASKLQEFQKEVALLEAKLETLKRILPPETEVPDLIRKLNNLAAQSNLAIREFNPAAPVTKEFYQEHPVNINVDGSYHNLAIFFDRVSRLTRLVNVGNLTIRGRTPQTATNTITAACVATTFVYMEPTPAPPGPRR